MTLEKSHWSFFNQLKELWILLKENPWKETQIHIHGINFLHDRGSLPCLSLFPNSQVTENSLTIQLSVHNSNQTCEISKQIKLESEKIVSQFFHTNDPGIENLEEKKSLKRKPFNTKHTL